MNKSLYWILWFVLWILVFTSINNGRLFTDASKSNEWIIEQLDGILANQKFNNRDYAVSIMDKSGALADLFEKDSVPYLAMKYINVNLKIKIDSMPKPIVKKAVEEAVVEKAEDDSSEDLHNSAEKEKTTEVQKSNDYRGTTWFPLPPKQKVAKEAPVDTNTDLWWFNMGKQEAPASAKVSTKQYVSNPIAYKYLVDWHLHTDSCAQKTCVASCLNSDLWYPESVCVEQCVSAVCMEIKKKNKLKSREISFAPAK